MQFIIEETLAQQILTYLADRPYKEVMVLIGQLMQLKKIEEPKEPAKE
jgi:uncharacterized iron-regulated protein